MYIITHIKNKASINILFTKLVEYSKSKGLIAGFGYKVNLIRKKMRIRRIRTKIPVYFTFKRSEHFVTVRDRII